MSLLSIDDEVNKTTARFSRTLSEAFKDERAPAIWDYRNRPIPTAPTWWQRVLRFLGR
jgi:hypothetical protein